MSNLGNFSTSSIPASPIFLSTSNGFGMSTQLGNFTSFSTTVTTSFASTSGGFEMKSQPGQSATFSKPDTGIYTATTSFLGSNYNDSPNIFNTNSQTRLPVVTPFSTQSSFGCLGNTNTDNLINVQQPANIKPFGVETALPAAKPAGFVFGTSATTNGFSQSQQVLFAIPIIYPTSLIPATPIFLSTSNGFGMPTQSGNFTSILTAVTPSFASTSGGFEMKSQPGQGVTLNKPDTGFCTTTTSFFGSNYNDSPNIFSTNSQTRLPDVTTSFIHLAHGKMTPFSTQSSSNTGFTNSNIGSGATNINADLTEAVVKFIPVSGTDTFKMNGVNLTIQTRNHCLCCLQKYETKHSEKLPFQNYTEDRKAGFNAHPSIFGGGTSNSTLGMSSVALTSKHSGITRQSGADVFCSQFSGFETPTTTNVCHSHLITAVSDSFAPFRKEEKIKAKEVDEAQSGVNARDVCELSSFQQFRKKAKVRKAEMRVKKTILKQEEASDAQATSSASIFAPKINTKLQTTQNSQTPLSINFLNKIGTGVIFSASNNEFGEFISTSTTNTTSVSDAGDRNFIASIDTNTQIGIDSKTTMIKDDKIQQLTEEMNSLKLDLKQFKDMLTESSPRGIKRLHQQKGEDKDRLLQKEQEKNRRLTEDIQNLRQQNKTLVNLNIELQKSMLNDSAPLEDVLKDLMNGNSINHSKEESKDNENESEDKKEKDNESENSDTEETNDEEKTPEIKMSYSHIVQQTPKSTITTEDDYTGPKLEDGKVTLKFMEELLKHYKKQGKLHITYAIKILLDVKSLFESQPTLVDIEIPDDGKFTICGDIHGQFFDLLHIFEINGFPSPSNPYLFNGDVVDRGSFSVECIFTLFGYKLLYPNHMFIARGNHETSSMNGKYGFEDEVKSKYTFRMALSFTKVFNWLPLAHCLNKKVLVMHGGLFSRDDVTLDEIRQIKRNIQPPETGIMCELLWSDPQSEPGREPSRRGGKRGLQFGPDVTKKFLEINDLNYIIRSHEYKSKGFEVCHDGKCITIFSAPNYCDTMGNKGAIIILNGKDLTYEFKSFEAAPHPVAMPMIAHENKSQQIFWIPCRGIN